MHDFLLLGIGLGFVTMLSLVGFLISLNNKRLIDTTTLSNQDLKEKYTIQGLEIGALQAEILRLQAEILRYQREVVIVSDKLERSTGETAVIQRLYESLLKKN